MVGSKVALLLFGLAAVAALPQPQGKININEPCWWPECLPWPPTIPDEWPESIPWPPVLPDQWPNPPCWWPDSLPWPPALPEEWPNSPCWWPEWLPWPPSVPGRPCWWPDSLPWPPALPDELPDRPCWWPGSLPWPPGIEDIPWPPTSIDTDRIPYIPSRDNQFHLFTRNNPSVSQPLVYENDYLLDFSNFWAGRRTVLLLHGHHEGATSPINSVLVPAFLSASDVNVIIVDWSAGAYSSVFFSSFYSVLSSNFVSRFTNWLTARTGADLRDFHIVGLGLGALNAGLIGRLLNSQVGYITALDPPQGICMTALLPPLNPYVSQYTEVIHTDAASRGVSQPLGDVDFYPNGGWNMPGCGMDSDCNRNRAVYFLAESLLSGGFSGIECANHQDALESNCGGPGRLNLGGLLPKTGSRGIFWVGVNAAPPFSQD